MFLKSLKLKGILSFRDAELKLRPLNVLIGPNGSGKSNLIKVIGLVSAFSRGEDGPARLASESVSGVGWLWAGEAAAGGEAMVEGVFEPPGGQEPLRYGLRFKTDDDLADLAGDGFTVTFHERLYEKGSVSKAVDMVGHRQGSISFGQKPLLARQSGTAELLRRGLIRTRIYRELGLGPSMASKRAQPTDQPDDFLEEDGSNLLMILNRMELDGSRKEVEEHFKRFYEPFQHSSIQLHPRGAQLAIKERRLRRFTQSSSLSDGTIRYLCLLAILCHPDPPPLICIEEPEIGLHPDILRDVALLLLEASERTQLIVTTHSDILINALSGDPETVVVCERDPDMGTSFERLSAKKLDLWLERYKLGELWRKGQLGGVPW